MNLTHLMGVSIPDRWCHSFANKAEDSDSDGNELEERNDSFRNNDFFFPENEVPVESNDKEDEKREAPCQVDQLAKCTYLSPSKKNKTEDPFITTLHLLREVDLDDGALLKKIQTACGLNVDHENFTEKLKAFASSENMIEFKTLLVWYHLLKMGTLPESGGYCDDEEQVKIILGVAAIYDILDLQKENHEMATIFELLDSKQDSNGSVYHEWRKEIVSLFKYFLETDQLFNTIKSLYSFTEEDSLENVRTTLNEMNLQLKFRFALYISIRSNFLLVEPLNEKELSTPPQLIPLMQKLDQKIFEITNDQSSPEEELEVGEIQEVKEEKDAEIAFFIPDVISKPNHKERCVRLMREGEIEHLEASFWLLRTHSLSKRKKYEIENILVMFNLLKMGFMPSSYRNSNGIDSIKKYLQINNLVDILNPYSGDTGDALHEFIKTFYQFFGKQEYLKEEENDYPSFLVMLMNEFYQLLETDKIIDEFQAFFDLDEEETEIYRPFFDKMNISSKIRWSFYISIAIFGSSEDATHPVCPRNLPEYQQILFSKIYLLLNAMFPSDH